MTQDASPMVGGLERMRAATPLDLVWQMVLRIAFPFVQMLRRVRARQYEGALVAVYVGPALLLVRSSYRVTWNFPGGGIRAGETPATAAQRELGEEIGLAIGGAAPALRPTGVIDGNWMGYPDRVHFFELRLDTAPKLQIDNREIIAARLVGPDELAGMKLTGPVAAYVAGQYTRLD